jgi:phosphoglycolate phosphatase
MIDLIVFDLDGTLVDSHRDIADAANAMLEEFGARPLPDAAIVQMVGEGAGVLVRRALAAAAIDAAPPTALERFLALYHGRMLEHTRPYEGMVETLASLREVAPMSVLTNKPQQPTEQILDGLGLARYFRHLVGGDTALGRKPDPAGLLHLVAASSVVPGRTLMVGDSAIDLQVARNAGTAVCLVRYGFGYRFAPDDFRGDELFVDRPGDLPALIRSIK